MTTAEFERWVRLGLGRAVTRLRAEADKSPFCDVVLRAATTNMAYDRQCEGDRAFYARELLRAAADNSADINPELLRAVLAHADKTGAETDMFDFSHYIALLGILHAEGIADASAALERLYARFFGMLAARERKSESMIDNELHLYRVIAKQLAVTIGGGRLPAIYADIAALLNKPELFDIFDFEVPLSEFECILQNLNPESLTLDADAQRVRDAFHALREECGRHTEEVSARGPKTVAELLNLAVSGEKLVPPYTRLMRGATTAEREALARLALDEPDDERKCSLLWLFTKNFSPWPLDPAPLIETARAYENNLTPDDEYRDPKWRLALAVMRVLACVRADPVREYAFELMRGEHREYAAKLWVKNYRPEDAAAFSEYIMSFPVDPNPDGNANWHTIQSDALNVFDEKTPGAPDALLRYIYESNYCALCRHRAVYQMAEKSLFDDALLREWALDSYSPTRDIALRLAAKRGE